MNASNHQRSSISFLALGLLSFAWLMGANAAPAIAQSHPLHSNDKAPTIKAADIVRDPSDLPPPVGDRAPALVKVTLTSKELVGALDPASGTTYRYFSPVNTDEFERLVAAMKPQGSKTPPTPSAAIVAARYEAKLVGERLTGRATLDVTLAGTASGLLPLAPCNVAIGKASWESDRLPSPIGRRVTLRSARLFQRQIEASPKGEGTYRRPLRPGIGQRRPLGGLGGTVGPAEPGVVAGRTPGFERCAGLSRSRFPPPRRIGCSSNCRTLSCRRSIED